MNEAFDCLISLLQADRSIRRYEEGVKVETETLKKLVSLTRFCASGRNLQPVKYRLVNEKEECEKIFPYLKWAGYLTDWDGPEKSERPSAYLIQCLDTSLTKNYLCDDGLQLQALTLGATALGLGCCIIKSFDALKICEVLNIPEGFQPLYVVSVGKPKEKVVIEDIRKEGDDGIKYYRTPDGVHHVPKRNTDDLIIKC